MKSCKKITVELFYDVISPYSWISFEALSRYNRKFFNLDLRLKPVLLGAIMKHHNQAPPVKAKSKYTALDIARLTKYFDLPYKRPEKLDHVMFEKGSLSAQRLLTSVSISFPSYLEDISRNLFLRIWSLDVDIFTYESLKQACLDVGISFDDANWLIKSIDTSDIKTSLKDTTFGALNYGAFGVPTYVVHLQNGPELLFGSDRLFLLAYYLGVQYPGPLLEFKA